MLVPGESTLSGPGEIVETHGSESYMALVWRRLKRSWTGMAGLFMVVLLIFIAFFADFLSPVDPIFFLHHANMDRLWDVWTRKQQALRLPIGAIPARMLAPP